MLGKWLLHHVCFVSILLLTDILALLVSGTLVDGEQPLAPKVMIISMWAPEGEVWQVRAPSVGLGNMSSIIVTSPGLSMLYPFVSCSASASICQVTIGEGEINAAASMMALVLSPQFDLRSTYFIISGIAGVSPRRGTLGSVAIARYAVQVSLQYELDARDLPSPDWPTGYIPYGRDQPFEYPLISYGTEVFELNADLRDKAYNLTADVPLEDSLGAREYRAKYASMGDAYEPATQPPSVVLCDSATSDVYYSGLRLAGAFEDTSGIWTNGSADYCMSAQEDNATLEVLLRAAIDGLVDFARVINMRSASNFDRAPPSMSDWEHLTHSDQNAFYISLDNLFNAGAAIVKGILHDWNCTYAAGIKPSNYIGDILGSLGGEPDFGYGSITGGVRVQPLGASRHVADSAAGRRSVRERMVPRAGKSKRWL